MSENLKAAEDNLASKEKHAHAVREAKRQLGLAAFTGDKTKIDAAQKNVDVAVTALQASGVTPRDVDVAAQAVLDARAEAAA